MILQISFLKKLEKPFLTIIDKDDLCGWINPGYEYDKEHKSYAFQYFNGVEFSGFDYPNFVHITHLHEFILDLKSNKKTFYDIRRRQASHYIRYFPETNEYIHMSMDPSDDFSGGAMKLILTKNKRLELCKTLENWKQFLIIDNKRDPSLWNKPRKSPISDKII